MKIAKKLVVTAVVLPLTLGAASAFAGGGKDHRGHCGGFDRSVMRQLDLTDAQKDQLKQLREANKTEREVYFKEHSAERQAEMKAQHEKVQQLILADTFDQAAANELAKSMVEKQSQRKVKMLEKQQQMLSILTPEQKDKFVELQKERADKCAKEMHNHFAHY